MSVSHALQVSCPSGLVQRWLGCADSTLATHKHIKFGTRVPFTCHAILVLLTQERRNKKLIMICAMLSSYLRELAWVASIRFTYIPSYLYAVCVIAIISVTYKHLCIKLKMHSCLRIYQDSRFEGVWKSYRCQCFWSGNLLYWLVSCCLVGMCFGSSWSIIYACMGINNIISFHLHLMLVVTASIRMICSLRKLQYCKCCKRHGVY